MPLFLPTTFCNFNKKDWVGGEALTSSVPVKNLAKQLCRSSNSIREQLNNFVDKVKVVQILSPGSEVGGRRNLKSFAQRMHKQDLLEHFFLSFAAHVPISGYPVVLRHYFSGSPHMASAIFPVDIVASRSASRLEYGQF
jgi:hypothetical protein